MLCTKSQRRFRMRHRMLVSCELGECWFIFCEGGLNEEMLLPGMSVSHTSQSYNSGSSGDTDLLSVFPHLYFVCLFELIDFR